MNHLHRYRLRLTLELNLLGIGRAESKGDTAVLMHLRRNEGCRAMV
jgi:hypothetical protein